eukprot:1959380-Prymnesium_polylepis.1
MCRTDQCVGSRPVLRLCPADFASGRVEFFYANSVVEAHGRAAVLLVWPPTVVQSGRLRPRQPYAAPRSPMAYGLRVIGNQQV